MRAPHPALVNAAVVSAIAMLAGPTLRFALRRRGRHPLADDLALLRWPVRLLAVTLFARIALPAAVERVERLAPLLNTALVAAGAWVVLRLLQVGQQVLFRRLDIDVADNLRARSRRTQITLLNRLVAAVIVVGAAFVVLVTVTPLGSLGPSLVAYAGLIGVVLGLALRAPLESVVAGIIVAVTEPIRIDDVVVVEEEWGHVEKIGLMNVVVRLWDDRRLVLPTTYFVSSPFENWTHEGSYVTGAVLLSVDFEVPIDELRREFEQVVRTSPLWDGRDMVLQVVDLGPSAVQVRGLVTAANAGDLWDLRCEVRERLLSFLTSRERSLPRLRAALPVG